VSIGSSCDVLLVDHSVNPDIDLTLVSQYFYPEMISTGHILTELLSELSGRGLRSSVICAQPTYYSTKKIDSLINYNGMKIFRTQNTQFDKNSVKGKIFNSTSFFLLSARIALKENSSRPLLLVTNPPLLGLLGPTFRLIRKRPFILIIHDLYPDIAVNMGYLRSKSLVTMLWKSLNRWVLRKASYIVALGRDMQELVRANLPVKDRLKVVYIPNWADPSVVYPVEAENNPLIKELGLVDKFLVQYSGNMGLSHDMETIIEAARELNGDKNIHFLMIGGGGKLNKVKDMALSYRLHNITFLPYQPRENLRYSLGASHVSLISLENGAQGLSVPSKLYGIMASGRPIIAIVPENSEVAFTVRDFNCGLVTPPKDVEALANAIVWLKSNETKRKVMGDRAHNAFLENFTVQRCADKYHNLIKSILVQSTLQR
jgi:glycosyltransferase involved in cell wall biosynthesis